MNINENLKVLKFGFIKQKVNTLFLNEINEIALFSDSVFKIQNIAIQAEEEINPRYVSLENTIYLPLSYAKKIQEETIYVKLEKYFNQKFKEVIAFHEFGHAIEDYEKKNLARIKLNHNVHLEYLFNGAAVPNKINNFMIEIYKEGFADCYAALCMYKKYNDLSVFDKLAKARKERYIDMKKTNGANFIHPNFNYYAVIEFEKIIEDLQNKNINILDLEFKNSIDGIEKYLETAVIKGCIKTLIKELENNDALLNHFKLFIKTDKDFTININNQVVYDYSKKFSLDKNDINNLNEEAILPYFFKFKNTSQEIINDKEINALINNKLFKRNVDPSLILMDVKEIPYNAGIECDKLKTICNIQNIRKDLNHNKNITMNLKV